MFCLMDKGLIAEQQDNGHTLIETISACRVCVKKESFSGGRCQSKIRDCILEYCSVIGENSYFYAKSYWFVKFVKFV